MSEDGPSWLTNFEDLDLGVCLDFKEEGLDTFDQISLRVQKKEKILRNEEKRA